jgi:general secretion pathway protein G
MENIMAFETTSGARRKAWCDCSRSSRICKRAGFTLMELLMVLVIVGLLAAVVGPTLYQRIKPAKETAVREQIENFGTALDGFMVDMGRYPTTQEGLKVLRTKPDGSEKWNGPYLKKEIPNDPWNNPYAYRSPGRSGGYEIVSFGADGREGGEGENADITSWEAPKKS